MDDNPYRSPTTSGGRGGAFPRIPSAIFVVAGLFLLWNAFAMSATTYRPPNPGPPSWVILGTVAAGLALLLAPLIRGAWRNPNS
jgi:hypothetical protein